jgi:hypothetical protein
MSVSSYFRDFPSLPSSHHTEPCQSLSTSIWLPELHSIYTALCLEQKIYTPAIFHPMAPKELKSQIETQLYQGLTQSAILQHWMQRTRSDISLGSAAAVAALQDAIIVASDAEWYEHDDHFITELGISVLDPRRIPMPTPSSPWDILSSMENHHVRIKPHAHLTNKDLCKGCPESFEFGSTTFVGVSEAKDMLRDIFTRRDEYGNLRPVIFMGHAVDNDYEIIKARFGLDLEEVGTIVATLDTQVLAVEHGLINPSRKMRLSNLLAAYDIEEQYLHNAGNDIVCTMIAAFLMLCPPPESKVLTNKLRYADLKAQLKASGQAAIREGGGYGATRFCTKCESHNHTTHFCKVSVWRCEHCIKDPLTKDAALTHSTVRCVNVVKQAALLRKQSSTGYGAGGAKRSSSPPNAYAVPCEYCIESRDPKRYKEENSYSHKTGECPWPK